MRIDGALLTAHQQADTSIFKIDLLESPHFAPTLLTGSALIRHDASVQKPDPVQCLWSFHDAMDFLLDHQNVRRTSADAKRRASAFKRAFAAQLAKLKSEPAAYGNVGLGELFEMREESLREFGFTDVYRWAPWCCSIAESHTRSGPG